jgi:hypothetical protein
MRWKGFGGGFVAGTAVSALVGGWAVVQSLKAGEDWTLPPRSFRAYGDVANGAGRVLFTGSIGGPEATAKPYNIFQGWCDQAELTCETQSVSKIGPGQLSSIDTSTYRITKWTPDLIIAESGDDWPVCVSIALHIRPPDKLVEYVRSPRAGVQQSELCRSTERRTVVWTIGDPPGRTPDA